jgi:hypothetical protein
MVASSWYSPLLANVFIWIVTKGEDSLFIDPLAEQVSCETMTANRTEWMICGATDFAGHLAHAQCRRDDTRGLEVSLGSLS